MYKLCFYVPESHVDSVKESVFKAGAGRIGNYEQCCWQVLGQGQFRPGSGSNPYIGQSGELTFVNEYRIECVCSDELIVKVVQALKVSHPYEEPAYEVYRLEDL